MNEKGQKAKSTKIREEGEQRYGMSSTSLLLLKEVDHEPDDP